MGTDHPLEGAAHVAQEKMINAVIAEHSKPVQEYADRHGVSFNDAHALMGERALLEAQRQELQPWPGAAPWLDTRELSEPPCPFSDEDWERDRRRADAAELTLSQDEWRAYAERGRDGVFELQQERLQATERERRRHLANETAVAQDRQRREQTRDSGGPGPGWKATQMDNGSTIWTPGP